VRAALGLLTAVTEFAVETKREHGIDFAMRVGLNTGMVVVGEVGSDLKFEYTAMGDAVNLAARMQSAARPMTVLISEHTHRFVAPIFDCVDLGQIEVKGKSEPVRVYEVAGAKAEPGRVRGLAGLESPMVGRDAELSALLQLSAAVHAGLGRAARVGREHEGRVNGLIHPLKGIFDPLKGIFDLQQHVINGEVEAAARRAGRPIQCVELDDVIGLAVDGESNMFECVIGQAEGRGGVLRGHADHRAVAQLQEESAPDELIAFAFVLNPLLQPHHPGRHLPARREEGGR